MVSTIAGDLTVVVDAHDVSPVGLVEAGESRCPPAFPHDRLPDALRWPFSGIENLANDLACRCRNPHADGVLGVAARLISWQQVWKHRRS